MATLRGMNQNINFKNLVIDSGTAVSNTASELVLSARMQYNIVGLVIPAVWTTADIGFEIQFEHETIPAWRRVDFKSIPVRVQIPTVNNFCIADAEIMVVLRMPITRLRIISINPSTYVPVNQGGERTVRLYMSE